MKNKILKISILVIIMVTGLMALAGCEYQNTNTEKDVKSTLNTGDKLANNQPTPKDINYSLERYNLIRRAYWVNGQRAKANTLVCEVEKPLGYIALFLENGSCAGKFVVDGKVTSLNSFLTPDSEFYEKNTAYRSGNTESTKPVYDYANKWLPDVDGSYGENDNGIFFFTTDGKYVEWTGTYLYSDIPFEIQNPVVTYKEGK